MSKHSVFVARFPYKGDEKSTVTDWLVETVLKMKADPTVGDIFQKAFDDTPITMTRNAACLAAREAGADYLLMVDNDMAPDIDKGLPGFVPFWDAAWPFAKARGDAIVAAPYCGPPPNECVYVFHWHQDQTGAADPGFALRMIDREYASTLTGVREVAALPTGLLLLPVAALSRLPLPWFAYEWKDRHEAQKASTEDVYFTRNASLAGVKCYCAWDSWAGHHKGKLVGKPQPLGPGAVARELRAALARPERGGVMMDVPENGFPLTGPGGFREPDRRVARPGGPRPGVEAAVVSLKPGVNAREPRPSPAARNGDWAREPQEVR